MKIQERIAALRQHMGARDIEAYIVPTADPHQSEYVPDYYKTREFMSGFTGSAGTLVITRREAGLWTDSRYFLQAENQLKGTGITLYRMGVDQTMEDFLRDKVSPFGKIGFDGLCFSVHRYRELAKAMGTRALITDVDYVSDIWTDRPHLPGHPAYVLSETYAGQSVAEKLRVLRFMMRERECDYTFISALEDVCYLFNLRGDDVEDTPVVLSYALISADEATLFIQPSKVTEEVQRALAAADVTLRPYDAVGDQLAEVAGQKVVYLDADATSITLFRALNDNVKIQYGTNLTSLMKAIKNETEIQNMREAFIKDGCALVRFFNWVETGAQTGGVNERSAVRKLHEFRTEGEHFLEDSFAAIVGYGSNAAIVHYDPMDADAPKTIEARGLLLVDSGGHYLEGTTDITRTVAMGPVSDEEREDYTLVLKSHIAGMTAQFPKNTTGAYVGAVAMAPLFAAKKRFFHGLGHGVGHILSVHEGPQTFTERPVAGALVELAPGMVTSMEPGLYIENSHGIRIESITLVEERGENEYGTWYGFECLTWVPIDTRPVDVRMLTDAELDWLNSYNETCFEKLSPHLDGEDLNYLAARCKPLERH
ncbi:MAG: aminopeptidase P family N-terminal domain-containing protein [Peptoniphilaceae bacterium]|nr:aminopeptidase P family N-terminal domain-containing protein [Peptoniphilaceae bacterium]MDY6085804.1 aminopeptidase P family N-terminal domain-containing protein [Peptoniphilaceae bacterium]